MQHRKNDEKNKEPSAWKENEKEKIQRRLRADCTTACKKLHMKVYTGEKFDESLHSKQMHCEVQGKGVN